MHRSSFWCFDFWNTKLNLKNNNNSNSKPTSHRMERIGNFCPVKILFHWVGAGDFWLEWRSMCGVSLLFFLFVHCWIYMATRFSCLAFPNQNETKRKCSKLYEYFMAFVLAADFGTPPGGRAAKVWAHWKDMDFLVLTVYIPNYLFVFFFFFFFR